MSPISIGMDVLLITLLIAAMAVGLRLNRQLKILRQGQGDFVRAVRELDGAAARAEAALTALRAASEDTHDALLTRIETARGLIVRLDEAGGAAAKLAALAATAPTPTAPVASPLARVAARLEGRFHEPEARFPLSDFARPPRPAARGLDDDLFESQEPPASLSRRAGAGR